MMIGVEEAAAMATAAIAGEVAAMSIAAEIADVSCSSSRSSDIHTVNIVTFASAHPVMC